MSSAENPGGRESGATAPPQQYFCHQCDHHVTIAPPTSPTAELVCPDCHGGFLEESDTAPAGNPTDILLNPFFGDSSPPSGGYGGGFPVIFSTPSAAPGGGGRGFDDLFSGTRSPNEFDPFNFLNNYVNSLQARGANIQIVFESRGGGGGRGVEFGIPANLGDYFGGPGLEQLIQQLAENDPNRYGTPPASKSAVEGLPDIKITAEILASDSSQCAVCTDGFELDGEAKQMPCKHTYHKDCILPWLELHNSCPICRYELPTDDPDYENQRTGQTNNNSSRNSNGSNLSFEAAGGDQGSRDDDNNNNNSPLTPRTTERRFRISLPWPFRGFGSSAETSGSGSNGGDNSNNNNSNFGPSNTGSGGGGGGGLAREEDLD